MEIPTEVGGRFTLGEEITKRASCTVFKANDKNLGGREVVVKIFLDRPEGNEAFLKEFDTEVEILRSASHPALVPIVSGGIENGYFYLAMEYIAGKTLRDVLKEANGPLDGERCVQVIVELAQGLHEIHEKGGTHGHIDARAVLFKAEEPRLAGYHPAVIDKIQKGSTSVARVIADPTCISPEQLSGAEQVDRRADIYALAVLLFQMVTGEKPFNAPNPLQAAMLRVTQSAPSPFKVNPKISPLLDAAISKGLARDPKDRFRSCPEFVDAITGGRKGYRNPLAEAAQRLGTETIAVSMSTDALKDILRQHEGEKPESAPTGQHAALDANATMMGVSTASLLKGSFIVLEGELRGRKFLIDKQQMMIGSDPSCNITLSARGIPPRYAIVIQRGERFYAAPLSPQPLTLNGEQMKAADEVQLQRGDVLNAGAYKLRFVAPGEVFTLKEDVADRTIDRPKSRLKARLLLGTCLVGVFAAASLYLLEQRQSERRAHHQRLEQQKAEQRGERIRQLTREADELFKNDALIEPEGANASERYRVILELDPQNTYAKRRLAEIDERIKALAKEKERRDQYAQRIDQLLADGNRYFQEKRYLSPPGANAKESYAEVLKLDPSNKAATARIGEIDTLMRDFLTSISATLATARSYAESGQYVTPPQQNALELVRQVQAIDPKNGEAAALLYEMAAKSIFQGDAAKSRLQPREARRMYLTAQALGVDPQYITGRMQGLQLIERSRGGVVIYSSGEKAAAESGAGYLSTAEIERRLGDLRLQAQLSGEKQKGTVIEVQPR